MDIVINNNECTRYSYEITYTSDYLIPAISVITKVHEGIWTWQNNNGNDILLVIIMIAVHNICIICTLYISDKNLKVIWIISEFVVVAYVSCTSWHIQKSHIFDTLVSIKYITHDSYDLLAVWNIYCDVWKLTDLNLKWCFFCELLF